MKLYQDIFFFLRVALWKNDLELQSVANYNWQTVDWQRLYELSKRQGLAAIVFDGISAVMVRLNDKSLGMPRQLKLRWLSLLDSIENKYDHQYKVVQKLAQIVTSQNMPSVLFKGVTLSLLYPIPNHRQCGDIDIYALDGRGDSLDKAIVDAGGKLLDVSPKHSELTLGDVMIEGHRYFVQRYFSKRAKWLDNRLVECANNSDTFIEGTKLYAPNVQFDTLFVIYHAANHFKFEGISLRHIVDWCFVVKRANCNISEVAQLGLEHFSAVLCRIGRDCLGFDFPDSICQCDELTYQRVLNDILGSDLNKSDENVSLFTLLKRKYERFSSRRWVYKLLGDTYWGGIVNSVVAHLVHPLSIFKGSK